MHCHRDYYPPYFDKAKTKGVAKVMKLCGASVSPYFERILIMLDMKDALDQIDIAAVPGGFKSDEHFRYHPLGKIPFLIKDDDSSLTESQVIAEYLDHILRGPHIVPDDFEAATQARMIARVMDLYYSAAVHPIGGAAFGGEISDAELEKARSQDIPAAFSYLEKYMGNGKRAVGDSWSIADAVLISQFYWYEALTPRFGLKDFSAHPKLNAYWNGVKDCDLVIRSFERVKKSYDEFAGEQDTGSAGST